MKRIFLVVLLISLAVLNAQVRLKDISSFSGLESKQLIGYGLVVGLDGTGDGSSSQMTVQSIKNMMERFGLTIPMNKIKPNNVAAVMVTGVLPAFAKIGTHFDVTISSVGDAKSLQGGTLLITPLSTVEGNQYAMSQGAVSIGGFNTGTDKSKIRKNYSLVGRIPDGGIVEKEVVSQLMYNSELTLNLQHPDFTTATRVAKVINQYFSLDLALAEDGASIQIIVPDSVVVERNLIGFISDIEHLEVIPERKARVVINERTGTIVAGGNVSLAQVAVAHGNLIIEVRYQSEAINAGGISSSYEATDIMTEAEKARLLVLEATTVKELARALNSIKVTPRDLISIFQSLKAAGALQAELIIL